MNNSIYPCIWFDRDAKQAAGFYCTVFPNTKVADDNELVTILELGGQKLMLLFAGPEFKPNPSISFLVICDSEEEVLDLWDQLAVDGTPLMPLDSYPWSKKYGWIKDKYGVAWQLYLGEKTGTDQKYIPTLMFCGEQNGKAEEAIHFYTALFPNSGVQGIMKYDDSGEDTAGNVQHAQFNIQGYMLACMDRSHPHQFGFDEGISLVVLTDDQEETDHYWNGFTADGGAESMCGWLKDKYGVSWQIVPKRLPELLNDQDKEKSHRAMQALMKMRKIVISELETAVEAVSA